MEETGLAGQPVGQLATFDWDYPHASLRFFPVLCRLDGPPPAAGGPSRPELRWVAVAELASYEFPPANAGLIEQLVNSFKPVE